MADTSLHHRVKKLCKEAKGLRKQEWEDKQLAQRLTELETECHQLRRELRDLTWYTYTSLKNHTHTGADRLHTSWPATFDFFNMPLYSSREPHAKPSKTTLPSNEELADASMYLDNEEGLVDQMLA